ncbi:MAG: methyltransferase domain-containing protein [Chloroflexota bacterium]
MTMINRVPIVNQYIEQLKKQGAIQTSQIESAFRQVPRHLLIEKIYSGRYDQPDILEIDPLNEEHLAMIYSDRALSIQWYPEPSSSSQPSLVAQMLELLTLKSGMRVLEIGAGSGYNAALMAELVSDPSLITTIDLNERLISTTKKQLANAGYEQINIYAQDGFDGFKANAPYDCIVATVGCADLSPYWFEQLSSDGFLLIPLSHGSIVQCPLTQIKKNDNGGTGKIVQYSNFMPIRGDQFSQNLWAFSTEEEEGRFVSHLQTTEVNAEYPLFHGLKDFPNHASGLPEAWTGRVEFHYFVALHRQDTLTCGKGLGLGGHSNCVIMGHDKILLYGDNSEILYQELEQIYQQWISLGKPQMNDYELEFMPLSTSTNEQKLNLEPNTWVIDRKFFRQIVRLL